MAMKFDYNATMMQVKELKNIAIDMRNIAKGEMQNEIKSVKSNWKGETSDIFCRKFEDLALNCESESKNLDEIAIELERLAQSINKAEEAAKAAIISR